jgi:hypothetical protein
MMAKALDDLGRVGSFEHDGLFVYASRKDPLRWRREVLDRLQAATGVALEEKPFPTLPNILAALKDKFGGDWETKEPLDQQRVVARALQHAPTGREHRLYAEIAAHELHTYLGYPMRDVFKHQGRGLYSAWCEQRGVWVPDSENGLLKLCISECLGRRLYGYNFVEVAERFTLNAVRAQAFPMVNDGSVLSRTEELARPMLEDETFHLDDEDARRFLCFENRVYDVEDDDFFAHTPHVPSSHTTGWALKTCGVTAEQHAELEAAMALWLRSEADEACRPDAEAALEALTFVPDLAFFHDITGCWENAVYALKHMVRAVFALRLQEHLWTRGPGANGKDTLANRMRLFLGATTSTACLARSCRPFGTRTRRASSSASSGAGASWRFARWPRTRS